MNSSKNYNERGIFAFIGWCLLWMLVQWNILLRIGVPQLEAITDSLISNLLINGCNFLIFNNLNYYLPRRDRHKYIITLSAALSIFCTIMERIGLYFFFSDDANYIHILKQSVPFRFIFAFLSIAYASSMSLLWFSTIEKEKEEAHKKEIEDLAKEAELIKLRQQFQPHFLFNSLNSISALTTSHPEKARHMIQELSDFLRSTLRKDQIHWNSLEEEFENLKLYLDIEKVRFGHRLKTEIITEMDTINKQIPSLLLQPVVENAIKFGLYDTIGEVTITIKATMENDTLHIKIANPFDPETSQPGRNAGTGFGLSSIERRLFLEFGRKDLLQTHIKEALFITEISIPSYRQTERSN